METIQLTDGETDVSDLFTLHYAVGQGTMELVGRCISKDISLMIEQANAYLDQCLRKGKLHFSFKTTYFEVHYGYLILAICQKLEESKEQILNAIGTIMKRIMIKRRKERISWI